MCEIIIFVLLSLKKWPRFASSLCKVSCFYNCVRAAVYSLYEGHHGHVVWAQLPHGFFSFDWVLPPPKLPAKCVRGHKVLPPPAVSEPSLTPLSPNLRPQSVPGGLLLNIQAGVFSPAAFSPGGCGAARGLGPNPWRQSRPPAPLLPFLAHTCSAEPAAEPQKEWRGFESPQYYLRSSILA